MNRRRYAASTWYCRQLGTAMAVDGWSLEQVLANVRENSNGSPITLRRILRAYRAQIARG